MKKLFNKILLLVLKKRLWKYRLDEKYYKKIADDSNYYTSYEIPKLIEQIKELESEINNS
jgi:hypothetical protein